MRAPQRKISRLGVANCPSRAGPLEQDPLCLAHTNVGRSFATPAKSLSSLLIHHDRPFFQAGPFAGFIVEILSWIPEL